MGEREPSDFGGGGVKSFVAHWSWTYVDYQMAEFYRETRNDQNLKSLTQYYNDLSFMKDHGRWQLEIAEKQALENRNGE